MGSLFDKVKKLATTHDDKVDKALRRVGDQVDKRTKGKYRAQIDRAVDEARRRTGPGDSARPHSPPPPPHTPPPPPPPH